MWIRIKLHVAYERGKPSSEPSQYGKMFLTIIVANARVRPYLRALSLGKYFMNGYIDANWKR